MASERDLGFLEGIIEGEGYIGLTKIKNRTSRKGFQWKPTLSVSNDSFELLRKVKKICNGGYFITKQGKKREFRISSNKMREFLPQLNFVNKRKQVKLVLRALKLVDENRHRKRSEKFLNDGELERIRSEIMRLNCGKKRFSLERKSKTGFYNVITSSAVAEPSAHS